MGENEQFQAPSNGVRWEYARFLSRDPTTVYFTHREEPWTDITEWRALYLLGEYGFELVSVTRVVSRYEGEQRPASATDMGLPTGRRTQDLQAAAVTSLYVLKRFVEPGEPKTLPDLPAREWEEEGEPDWTVTPGEPRQERERKRVLREQERARQPPAGLPPDQMAAWRRGRRSF